MNRIFNLIWSKTKESWIVVSEHVKGNGKVPSSPLRSVAVLTALFSSGGVAYAIDSATLPAGGQITAGTGTITANGTQMTINQTSPQLIANWESFNIGENAAVRFNQPGISSLALNRIADRNPTQIMGSLSSNGQVFLLNQAGIIFGKTATINVGSLVASSLTMPDSDFLAGRYRFGGNGSAGAILNQGAIKAMNDGVVALMAPTVTNEGSLTANSGSVLLAAGNQVTLDFTGDGLINYTVDQGAVDALVENRGLIKADGGVVVMSARAADVLRMATATNSGVIEARTIQNKAGRILLLSDMENGQTLVSGTLDASAPDGGNGGFIETSSGRVRISDGTVVTTLAPQGKSGMWLIDPPPGIDFTIASDKGGSVTAGIPDGDISGSTLAAALGSGDVTILSSQGSSSPGFGNIKVNDVVSWSKNKLTLIATNDINVNAVMTAGATDDTGAPGTFATLDLEPGSGKVNMGFNPEGSFRGRVNFFQADGMTPRSGSGFLVINSSPYTVINTADALQDPVAGNYALGSSFSVSSIVNFKPVDLSVTFDGLGHTISDLTIDRSSENYTGLFSNSSGIIRNVGLVAVSVTGGAYTGGLVGRNNGTIANSYVSGDVTGSGNKGGLVGESFGSIANSYAMGTVKGDTGNNAGGLVGFNHDTSTITRSYATGSVSGGKYKGGLVGRNSGDITNCYATGSVSGGKYNGGLVGYNDNGTITNSYARGSVSGTNYLGALVGRNNNVHSILNSFYESDVNPLLRGVVNESDAPGYVTGLTTPDMKLEANFTTSTTANGSVNPGWDFTPGTGIWKIDPAKNGGYPYLTWQMLTPFIALVPYTLSDLTVTYKGSAYLLNDLWSATTLFGGSYNSWTAGTDYSFLDDGSPVTGFTNVGNYASLSINVIKEGYAVAATGNTTGSLTIDPAHLTVRADNQSRLYGAGNPLFTETITGFVNGETTGVVSGTATGSSTATAATGVGTAIITGSTAGLSASNYDFTAANGVLTIDPAHLTVRADNQSRLYGAGNPLFTETITGFVNGETTGVVSGTATGSSTATAATGVGTAIITGSTAGLSASNYDFTAANGVLTIDPAHLTVRADNQSRLYGAGNPLFTETITGFVNGETAGVVSGTATGSSTATATTGVGTAIITASIAGLSASNYDFTAVNGILTIAPAHLTVTADNQSRRYGASNPLFTETITGFVNGETSGVVSGTATGSSTATATTGVGTAIITGSIVGLSSSNYDFAAADGVLTITPDKRERPVIPEPSEGGDPFHESTVTPPDQVVTEGALLGGEEGSN